MRRLLTIAVVVATAALALANDEELTGDLAKLQGKWTGMIGENNDRPVTVEVKGKKVNATYVNGEGETAKLKGELKLDEKAKPKTVDWINFTAPDGEELPPNLGIYELNGDEWKICNGDPGNERPTEFRKGEDNSPPRLIVLKRQRDAADGK